MMTQHSSSTQNFRKKALHGLIYIAVALFLVMFGSMNAKQARAQSAAADSATCRRAREL